MRNLKPIAASGVLGAFNTAEVAESAGLSCCCAWVDSYEWPACRTDLPSGFNEKSLALIALVPRCNYGQCSFIHLHRKTCLGWKRQSASMQMA
jgi:hypothetical protein